MKKSFLSGLSLVEVLISFTIFLLVLPIILKSISNTQSFVFRANTDTELQMEADRIFQHLRKDIKESVVIFDNETKDINSFKELYFKNSIPNISLTLNNQPSQIIMMMKNLGKESVIVNGIEKTLDIFSILCYYPEKLNNNASNLSLTKIQSIDKFYNSDSLSEEESSFMKNNNYRLWELPTRGYRPKLPENINSINFNKMKFSSNIAPSGYIYKELTLIFGGFEVIQSDKILNIKITSTKKIPQGTKENSFKTQIVLPI